MSDEVVLREAEWLSGPPRGERVLWRSRREAFEYGESCSPMVTMFCRFFVWLSSGSCKIQDRDVPTKVVPFGLVLRVGQLRLYRNCLCQAVERRPIRQIVPKYRRHGISTAVQALLKFIVDTMRMYNCRTVAHTDEAAQKIFRITHLMHTECGGVVQKKNVAQRRIENEDLSSSYQCISGIGDFAASGDTIHCLHVSEYAKFPNTSDQDKTSMNSMVNAVAQESPYTIIIIESSGQGSRGDFPDRARAAYEGRGSYGCVFLPWTLDKSLSLDEDGLLEEWDPPLSGDEITLKERHGATDGQIAWRRQKFSNDFPQASFGETPPEFKWDYPLEFEDCFAEKSGRVYPMFRRSKHEGEVVSEDFSKSSYYARAIDWGSSESHAFVCLWLRVDPEKPAQVVVHPRCVNFIGEHEGYSYNSKTGRPNKSDDHTCDAFRDFLATVRPEGLVYVFQELYVTDHTNESPESLCRKVHQMTGWVHPSGDSEDPDIKRYKPGVHGLKIERTVADRAGRENIKQWRLWGIPIEPHTFPNDNSTPATEVADGIVRASIMFAGDAQYRTTPSNVKAALLASAVEKLHGGRRRRLLTKEEREEYMKASRKGITRRSEPLIHVGADLDLYATSRR